MKSKFAVHPLSLLPLQSGEALARASAARHPSIPPHSDSLALSADRLALLRMRTCGHPLASAAAL